MHLNYTSLQSQTGRQGPVDRTRIAVLDVQLSGRLLFPSTDPAQSIVCVLVAERNSKMATAPPGYRWAQLPVEYPARGWVPRLEQGGHVEERRHELLCHEAHEVLQALLWIAKW